MPETSQSNRTDKEIKGLILIHWKDIDLNY